MVNQFFHLFRYLLLLAVLAIPDPVSATGQDTELDERLIEIAKTINSVKGRNAETVLDRQIKTLHQLRRNEGDKDRGKVIEKILFQAGCKYQFINKDKAKKLFADMISTSGDFGIKAKCSYQLGFADWGSPEAATHYELAIRYMIEAEDSAGYESLLGNCYGNAGFLYANFDQPDQAKQIYTEFFAHDNLPSKVRPDLTISYAANLSDLEPEMTEEQLASVQDFVTNALVRATRSSNTNTIQKSCDAAIRLFSFSLNSGQPFDNTAKIAELIKKLIQKSGNNNRLLQFLVEWQLVAFFESVKHPKFDPVVAESVSDTASEIADLLVEIRESDPRSVLEKDNAEFSRKELWIRTQSSLMMAACSKFGRANSPMPYRDTVELLDKQGEEKHEFRPVVPDYGKARRWDESLKTAIDLVQQNEFDQITLEIFQTENKSSRDMPKQQPLSQRRPTLANPKTIQN